MARLKISRLDGTRVPATYVRHRRTLTYGGRSSDVDVYRLADGTEVECISPSDDGRAIPVECDPRSDHYPGYPAGV